ncbi:hypothetical protein [Corallococcus macrosporus]|uniref:Uncharacterized protein n=1 Tax=Corallococcus macrosporus DSM 14697 TaxID=1189310 RepID=A0A250K207_9BACT|nr:hypothetical protein [Corallococcus macrosporus]ATB50043.1 hypothetical protein MYMAC_005698 [Corallococcus macrosporus DSM 14697]
MSDEAHLDINELMKERKGWFHKHDEGMPEHRRYGRSCRSGGDGYLGPWANAHHLLPQNAFFRSTENHPNQAYIERVKWITPYNINRPSNMLGMPSFNIYALHYQRQRTLDELRHPEGKAREYVSKFNEQEARLRQRWLDKIVSGGPNMSPETIAIHLPVSFGHTEYNDVVTSALMENVWQVLNKEKDAHRISKATFQAVQDALTRLETRFRQRLKSRSTSIKQWKRQNDPEATDWHEPYVMEATSDPLRK